MMDELNVNRGFSPHFSPSRNLSNAENQQQLYIHLPNHGFRMIRIDEAADVRSIVRNLVGSMSSPIGVKPNCHYYALRLRHIISKEILWLPSSEFYHIRFINFLLIALQLLFSHELQLPPRVKSSTTFRMNHARISTAPVSSKHRRL